MMGAAIRSTNPASAERARMAQMFYTMMMDIVHAQPGAVDWIDVCFAMGVAMRAQAEIAAQALGRPREQVLQDLRATFDIAMAQEFIVKRVDNPDDAAAAHDAGATSPRREH